MESVKKLKENEDGEFALKYQEYSDIDDEYDEIEEYKVENDLELGAKYIENIYDTRIEMLDYCDDTALPLCDYLTYNSISKFIDFLKGF